MKNPFNENMSDLEIFRAYDKALEEVTDPDDIEELKKLMKQYHRSLIKRQSELAMQGWMF